MNYTPKVRITFGSRYFSFIWSNLVGILYLRQKEVGTKVRNTSVPAYTDFFFFNHELHEPYKELKPYDGESNSFICSNLILHEPYKELKLNSSILDISSFVHCMNPIRN